MGPLVLGRRPLFFLDFGPSFLKRACTSSSVDFVLRAKRAIHESSSLAEDFKKFFSEENHRISGNPQQGKKRLYQSAMINLQIGPSTRT